MATTDPREKLLQTGNELLDVIYWLATKADDAGALVKRLNASSATAGGDPADATVVEESIGLAMEGFRMVARRNELAAQYTLLRSTIEAMEAGRVDLPDVD